MPPELGHRYPADWQGSPPHMAHTDLPLWHRALVQLAPLVTQWFFDVAVGVGQVMPEEISEDMRAGLWRLSRMRIDAVGETRSAWLIIEVRPNAGLGAIGHVHTYRSLWERDPPDIRPTRAYLVTDRAQADVLQTCINANITLLQV